MPPCWKIELQPPAGEADRLAAALDELCAVVRCDIDEQSGAPARLIGYTDIAPDRAAIAALLAAAVGDADGPPPTFDLVELPAQDWVAESQRRFPPLRTGVFLVHDRDHRPPDGVVRRATRPVTVEITANVAFGTGAHATTRGCLAALDRLARRRLVGGAILDVGTGTGVLAIAAAKRLGRPVVASDLDPSAVAVAAANVRLNGLAACVRVVRARDYHHRTITRHAPYALVMANILAAPLAASAASLAAHLAPGGRAVLSGFVARQQRQVLGPHLAAGLVVRDRSVRDGWVTLTLAKRASAGAAAGPANRIIG